MSDNEVSNVTTTTSAVECPVCAPAGQVISCGISAAIRGSSVLKCRASGLLMTQDNPPLACPNGQVYCKHYIFSHVSMVKRGGSDEEIPCFACPITKQVFEVKKLRQVYIA